MQAERKTVNIACHGRTGKDVPGRPGARGDLPGRARGVLAHDRTTRAWQDVPGSPGARGDLPGQARGVLARDRTARCQRIPFTGK